jgi:hypothetical protein
MTMDRGLFALGDRDDRPLRGVLHTRIEESYDGRHWRACAAGGLIVGAGTTQPTRRMLRVKIVAGSPLTEDIWP